MIRFLIVDYECTKGHVHSAEEGEQYRLCSCLPYSVLPGLPDRQLMNDHCNTQIGSKINFNIEKVLEVSLRGVSGQSVTQSLRTYKLTNIRSSSDQAEKYWTTFSCLPRTA